MAMDVVPTKNTRYCVINRLFDWGKNTKIRLKGSVESQEIDTEGLSDRKGTYCKKITMKNGEENSVCGS